MQSVKSLCQERPGVAGLTQQETLRPCRPAARAVAKYELQRVVRVHLGSDEAAYRCPSLAAVSSNHLRQLLQQALSPPRRWATACTVHDPCRGARSWFTLHRCPSSSCHRTERWGPCTWPSRRRTLPGITHSILRSMLTATSAACIPAQQDWPDRSPASSCCRRPLVRMHEGATSAAAATGCQTHTDRVAGTIQRALARFY